MGLIMGRMGSSPIIDRIMGRYFKVKHQAEFRYVWTLLEDTHNIVMTFPTFNFCIHCVLRGACLTSASFFNRFRVQYSLLYNPTKAIENSAGFALSCYKNTIDGITSSCFVKPSVTDTDSIRSNPPRIDTFIIFPQQSSSAWAVAHNTSMNERSVHT